MTIEQHRTRSFFRLPDTLQPLTDKYFGIFWVGSFLSSLGFWIQNVAQGWQVLQLTNSAFLLSLVSFIGAIPNLFLLLFGGVLADRIDRRLLVILTESLFLGIALLQGVLTSLHLITVWYILIIACVNGIFSALAYPAWQAFISNLMPRGQVKHGFMLNFMQWNLARVIGPALGGLSVGIFGIAGSYYLNALSYAAVVIPLLIMRPPVQEQAKALSQNMWKELKAGFLSLKERPFLQFYMGLQLTISFLMLPYITLLPVFARDVFHSGPAGLGILNAADGIGALLGTLVMFGAMVRLQPTTRVRLCCYSLGALACCLLGWAPTQTIAMIALFILNVSMMIIGIIHNNFIQSTIPEEIRGRITSILGLIPLGIAPLGNLLMGAIAQSHGAPFSVTLGGLLCGLITLSLVLLQWRVER